MIRACYAPRAGAGGAAAATGGGMRQVTNSRKAAARYRAEYLRQSNVPTSAAATCDNTVRCACARAPAALRRCIPNDIELETSRAISAHSICALRSGNPALLASWLLTLLISYRSNIWASTGNFCGCSIKPNIWESYYAHADRYT